MRPRRVGILDAFGIGSDIFIVVLILLLLMTTGFGFNKADYIKLKDLGEGSGFHTHLDLVIANPEGDDFSWFEMRQAPMVNGGVHEFGFRLWGNWTINQTIAETVPVIGNSSATDDDDSEAQIVFVQQEVVRDGWQEFSLADLRAYMA